MSSSDPNMACSSSPACPGVSGDPCRAVAVMTAKNLGSNEADGLVVFLLETGAANPGELFKLVPAEVIGDNLESGRYKQARTVRERCKVAEIKVDGRPTQCRIFARVEKGKLTEHFVVKTELIW